MSNAKSATFESTTTFVSEDTYKEVVGILANTTFYIGCIIGFVFSTIFGTTGLLVVAVGYCLYRLFISRKTDK